MEERSKYKKFLERKNKRKKERKKKLRNLKRETDIWKFTNKRGKRSWIQQEKDMEITRSIRKNRGTTS